MSSVAILFAKQLKALPINYFFVVAHTTTFTKL